MGSIVDQWKSTGLSRVPSPSAMEKGGKYSYTEESVYNLGVPLLSGSRTCTRWGFVEVVHPMHGAAALPRLCTLGIHIHRFIVREWCAGLWWPHTNTHWNSSTTFCCCTLPWLPLHLYIPPTTHRRLVIHWGNPTPANSRQKVQHREADQLVDPLIITTQLLHIFTQFKAYTWSGRTPATFCWV